MFIELSSNDYALFYLELPVNSKNISLPVTEIDQVISTSNSDMEFDGEKCSNDCDEDLENNEDSTMYTATMKK